MPELKMDPVTRFVRNLEGNYYLVREAADLLGVHHRTLRKYNEDPDLDLGPSFQAFLGKIMIYLYTDDDLQKIREYLEAQNRVYPKRERGQPVPKGRPAKFTKEDRKERQKLYSKAHYYGKRAEEETANGELGKAKDYLSKQRKIKKELEQWQRSESLSE